MGPGPLSGADVEALLVMAEALLDTADLLEAVDLRTADGLASVGWRGADAERVRADWDDRHAVTLHVTAATFRTGADHLVTQAEDQEVASGAGRGAPASGGPTTPGLRERLAARVHDGLTSSGRVVDGLAPVTVTVTGMTVLGDLRVRAAQALAVGEHVADLSIGPATSGALATVSAVGVVTGAHDAYHGYREGDLWRTTDGAVSSALAAAAARGNVPAAVGGVGWWIGGRVGEGANAAMAGTDFERRFTDRMDGVFDTIGAAGVAVVPGALIVAGVETTAAAVTDGVSAAGEWVGDSWRSLTEAAPDPGASADPPEGP